MIDAKLNEVRRGLIDLTRNNRLLNLRTRAQSCLQIVEASPAELYRKLIDEAQVLEFASCEEAPPEVRDRLPGEQVDGVAQPPETTDQSEAPGAGQPSTINVPADSPSASAAADNVAGNVLPPSADNGALASETAPTGGPQREIAVAHAGDGPPAVHVQAAAAAEQTQSKPQPRRPNKHLQTALSSSKLQIRLIHLAREAASAIQEQGCNILYVTLGVVEWSQNDNPEVKSRAPLIFVPVELKRKTINTRHTLQVFDDDIVANASLVELCQTEFQFELPTFEAEKDDLDAYFSRVQQAISSMSGWQFLPELYLGLFSFSKLLMYRDLDPKNWPSPENLTGHPLVRQLTGVEPDANSDNHIDGRENERKDDSGASQAIPDPATLDEILKPLDCFQILDADSSQQAAILAAKHGVSMVIDGPPGTGKSQTITNIIAECLAAGRTVLFVSEKAAALEVVKRRMENNGAGDFVLELHSRQASKKAVLAEINRVLEKRAVAAGASQQSAEQLLRTRRALSEHHRELHESTSRLNISPFEATSRAIGLADEPDVNCALPQVLEWSEAQLIDAIEHLQALDRRLARVGPLATHPWRGTGLHAAGLQQRSHIQQLREDFSAALRQLLSEGSALASELGKAAPKDIGAASEIATLAEAILKLPADAGACAADARWDKPDPEIDAILDSGQRREILEQTWQSVFKPDAETRDWPPILQRWGARHRSFFRFLIASWHRDNRLLAACTLDGKRPPADRTLDLLQTLIDSGYLRKQIEEKSASLAARFGGTWHGIDGDWKALAQFEKSALAARALVQQGRIEAAELTRLLQPANQSDLAPLANKTRAALDQVQQLFKEWLAAIESDEKSWLKAPWETVELSTVADRLDELKQHAERLDDWVDLRQSIQEYSNGPLKNYIAWLFGPKGSVAFGRLAATFQRHFYRLWLEEAMASRLQLKNFRVEDHRAAVDQFRQLDQQWIVSTPSRLAEALSTRRPEAINTIHRESKLGLVLAEIRKKARHMPLRKLLQQAGEVIQAIKPCFMMSPLSVAQYLAAGGLQFDVVVFDEASQVEPADAYGAIVRGRQLILVGDERQLPPTNFFSRIDRDESDAVDQDEASEVRTGDLESILSLGIVRLRHRCGLRWHYRSRHSSLIEFSNEKFYDGQLRVFPSPHTDCSELGLAFQYVEGAVYMRGAGRHNPKEADAVANAVIDHALQHPDLSLGVGTLNQPQQHAIEDAVEHLRRTNSDPRIEQFFAKQTARNEPFFVKNIESIQGDERDVMLLSITFGKDANGKMYASFGALNGENGWRRLNVLITRARLRCIVFSSVRHDDINLGSTQARGVVALKEFLYTAEHGRIGEASVPGGDFESDFEASVCRALRDRGWQVHLQVGCAGFAIDLAVVDPRAPGKYLLGIECDGATYHSSPTARDRDRLRQRVLEDLGWTIYRIWSTDWFQRPNAALAALLKRLDEIKNAPVPNPAEMPQSAAALAPPVAQPPQAQATTDAPPEGNPKENFAAALPPSAPHDGHHELPHGVVSYASARDAIPKVGRDLTQTPVVDVAGVIRNLVDVEGPIHIDEVSRVCAEAFGKKATARQREAILRAVHFAVSKGWITHQSDFLRSPRRQGIPIRFRGNGCPVTNPDLIPPEEIDQAVRLALQQQFGLKLDALAEAVARLFGFARTGAKFKVASEAAIVRLAESGQIQQDGASFVTLKHTT